MDVDTHSLFFTPCVYATRLVHCEGTIGDYHPAAQDLPGRVVLQKRGRRPARDRMTVRCASAGPVMACGPRRAPDAPARWTTSERERARGTGAGATGNAQAGAGARPHAAGGAASRTRAWPLLAPADGGRAGERGRWSA
jgi:hypothetical protein